MLKEGIPQIVYEMKEMKELMDAEQKELNKLDERIFYINHQLHISTATDYLENFEKQYGINTNLQSTIETRRSTVLAKRNMRNTATNENICSCVRTILNANNVTIEEKVDHFMFQIFVGTDYLIGSLEDAIRMVWIMRPAHLTFEFVNTLNRNTELNAYSGIVSGIMKEFGIEDIEE